VRAPGRNAPLIRFLISALYVLFACLYRTLPQLCFFSSVFRFFLTNLLRCLSFPLRIDPLRFQAGYRKRRLNLALVACVCFVLWYISFDWRMRAFVVLGLVFFSCKAKRLAWGNVSEMCPVGRKTTTQSINGGRPPAQWKHCRSIGFGDLGSG